MNMFRELRADEIDCRISQIKQKDGKPTGLTLLLYKDARCDQNILDEVVGPYNWMRQHSRDNRNCVVSLWDKEKQQWISKEDTGTESNTEKEKGLASDSFKRACFNWGIGRELYTAPWIWVSADKCSIININGRFACYDEFSVSFIAYKDGVISGLKIKNLRSGKVVFAWGDDQERAKEPEKEPETAETEQEVKAEKKPSNANVSVSDSVPDVSTPMGYLKNEITFLAADYSVSFTEMRTRINVYYKTLLAGGLIPEKKFTDMTMDDVKQFIEAVKTNFPPEGAA